MPSTNSITKRERDCVVYIREYSMNSFPMRLHELAGVMKIKPPTALDLINRLKAKGLVESRDGMVILTDYGNSVARGILLVHRTFESLFCQSGVSKENACRDSGEIDYLISKKSANLILKKINNPKLCPHGKPISEV